MQCCLGGGYLINKSYAVYQESVSFKVMEGTVNYEGSGDVFFAFYDGDNEQLTEMPKKDNSEGLIYDYGECNNGARVEWDNDRYGPFIANLSASKTKCTLYFTNAKSITCKNNPNGLSCYVAKLFDNNRTMLSYDTSDDKNLRYIGNSPYNYIDIGDRYAGDVYRGYNSTSSRDGYHDYATLDSCNKGYYNKNCEKIHNNGEPILWRIIGIMNNVPIIDDDDVTHQESLVKIIRDESIGTWGYVSVNNYGYNGVFLM